MLASFGEYTDAVALVEKLVEANFPMTAIAIVGKDLKTVERIRGRMNYGKVALSGATTGAFIGFVLSLFSPVPEGADASSIAVSNVIQPVLIAAGIGMMFNIVQHRALRDVSQQAQLYELIDGDGQRIRSSGAEQPSGAGPRSSRQTYRGCVTK
ncbi:MAG: hypothetical protein RI919_678 [Actinomycetota bacterium]